MLHLKSVNVMENDAPITPFTECLDDKAYGEYVEANNLHAKSKLMRACYVAMLKY